MISVNEDDGQQDDVQDIILEPLSSTLINSNVTSSHSADIDQVRWRINGRNFLKCRHTVHLNVSPMFKIVRLFTFSLWQLIGGIPLHGRSSKRTTHKNGQTT